MPTNPIPTMLPTAQDPLGGDPGGYITPEQLKSQQAYAEALLQAGMPGSIPVGKSGNVQAVSPWGGLASMVSALAGQQRLNALNKGEIASRQYDLGQMPLAAGSRQPGQVGALGWPSQNNQGAGSTALGFQATDSDGGNTVRGSWFGQYPQGGWPRDTMASDRTASGTRTSVEGGIALPNKKTLGQDFVVTDPQGREHIVKQTDVGPAKWTGRGIDVTAKTAADWGYTPANFPTDKGFKIRPYNPQSDAGLRATPFADEGPGQQMAGGPGDLALSRGGPGAGRGGPAGMPGPAGAGAPAPGFFPMRPQVSRDQFIGKGGFWLTPEERTGLESMYYGQHMPVSVPGTGGQWILNEQGQAIWVAEPQMEHFKMPGGVEMPAPYTYQPDGRGGYRIQPTPITGGPAAASVTPAPQGTPVPSIDLTADPNRPGVTPPVAVPGPSGTATPPVKAPLQYASADAPTSLPPEITQGHSAPGGGGMLSTAPPASPPQEPGKLAFQPGQAAETPAPAPAPSGFGGMDPWHMTPEQMMGMGQQYQTNLEAGKAHAAEDAKEYNDWMKSTQHAASASYELQNRLKLANKLVNDPRLQQVMGPGADTVKLPWNKFLSFFGDEKATERVGLSQAFEKLKSSNILADLSQKLHGLGQIRLAEIMLAAQSNIGRDNTPAANRAIISLGEKVQWQMQKLGQIDQLYDQGYRWGPDGKMLPQKSGEPPSFAGLAAVENQFMKNNPIATDQEMDQMEHLFDISGSETTSKPNVPAVSDNDRLKKAIERKTKAQ